MSLILNSGFTIGPGVVLQSGTTTTIPVVSNGLILHLDQYEASSWPGSGTTWYDISGNDKHATFYSNSGQSEGDGTPINGASLIHNGNFYFNGASGSGLYQYAAGPNLGTNIVTWTINTWFKVNSFVSTGTLPAIFTGRYTGDGDPSHGHVNFSLQFYNGSGNDNAVYPGFFDGSWHIGNGYNPGSDLWYNGVVTYDGNDLNLYINNLLISSLTAPSTSMVSSLGYRVGRRWDAYDSFDGYIPIAMLYNRALSVPEIAQNYNAHKGRFGL